MKVNIKEALNFRENLNEEKALNKIVDTFNNSSPKLENIILSIGYIVYRLRNNLFHGLKPFTTLKGQNKNFKMSNNFLIEFIDTIKR